MAKKRSHHLTFFPLLALVSPFIIFLILSLVRMAKGGTLTMQSYWNNFIYLYNAIKNGHEYLFPCIAYFTIGLCCLLLNRFFRKTPLKKNLWFFLVSCGTIMILFGSRLLFLYANDLLFSPQAVDFLKTAIDAYTFTVSLEGCLLTSFVLHLLDVLYLNAK